MVFDRLFDREADDTLTVAIAVDIILFLRPVRLAICLFEECWYSERLSAAAAAVKCAVAGLSRLRIGVSVRLAVAAALRRPAAAPAGAAAAHLRGLQRRL